MNPVLAVIGIYVMAHLIITVARGYLRVKKYQKHYQQEGREKGAMARGLEKRILHPWTFIYALLVTGVAYLCWFALTKVGVI